MSEKISFRDRVVQKLLDELKQGTAPWLKPWSAENRMPFNPTTQKRYRGINAFYLAAQNREDARWMTYRQAQEKGWQVRKGEKGTTVSYWKFTESKPAVDELGKPIFLDKEKKKRKMVDVKLERPRVFNAVVFNAEQIDGVPELEKRELGWNPHKRAEKILESSRAEIHHDQADNAFYRPGTDSIHLPKREQFVSADRYYATALHELGHWTGHPSRLERDLAHPFGSEGYAKEELRAEMSSMFLGEELGIGHDPGQHASYIASWIRVLENEPSELFRAASDAEKITTYLFDLEKEQSLNIPLEVEKEVVPPSSNTSDKRTALVVPFVEKDEAKKLGAEWDREKKIWFVQPGNDLTPFTKWLTSAQMPVRQDPVVEFTEALKNAGLKVDQPVMDGRLHRVAVEGDKAGKKSGAYVGYENPNSASAGFIQNFKADVKLTWRSSDSQQMDKTAREALLAQIRDSQKAFEKEQHEKQQQKAQEVAAAIAKLAAANDDNGYLSRKGVRSVDGLRQDTRGNLIVPIMDTDGKIWSKQWIYANGQKGFEKGARKSGLFFEIRPNGKPQENHQPLLVVEGLSTGLSVAQATGLNVFVAFDASNLAPVSQSLKSVFKDSKIFVLGDNDLGKVNAKGEKINPGKRAAEIAAESVNGEVILPEVVGGTDWNDLHQKSGISAVKTQLYSKVMPKGVSSTIEKIQESVTTSNLGSEDKSSEFRFEIWKEALYDIGRARKGEVDRDRESVRTSLNLDKDKQMYIHVKSDLVGAFRGVHQIAGKTFAVVDADRKIALVPIKEGAKLAIAASEQRVKLSFSRSGESKSDIVKLAFDRGRSEKVRQRTKQQNVEAELD